MANTEDKNQNTEAEEKKTEDSSEEKKEETTEEENKGNDQQSAGVVALQQFISFKLEGTLDVFAAKTGTIKEVEDSATNKTITIDYGDDQVLKYCGFIKFSENVMKAKSGQNLQGSDSSSVKVKDVLGQAKGTFTIMYYRNGTLEDPKLIWSKLNGKVSEKNSLGKQNSEGERQGGKPAGANKDGVTTASDNSVIGGDTVGAYDMDDLNNYFWNLDDSKSLKKNKAKSDATDATDNSGENNQRSENSITDGPSVNEYNLSGDTTGLSDSGNKYSAILFDDFRIPADKYTDNSAKNIEEHQMSENKEACLQHHYIVGENAITSGLPLAKYSARESGTVMVLMSGNMTYGEVNSSMTVKLGQLVAALASKYGFTISKETVRVNSGTGSGFTNHYEEILNKAKEIYDQIAASSGESDNGKKDEGTNSEKKKCWKIVTTSVEKIVVSKIPESVYGQKVSCIADQKNDTTLKIRVYTQTKEENAINRFTDTLRFSAGQEDETDKEHKVTILGSELSKYMTVADFANVFSYD